MKSKKLLTGTLVIGMAFGFMAAGCASTGGAKSPALEAATIDTAATAVDAAAVATVTLPTAAELAAAAQLAADINAIKEGSATVDGATVTLTDWLFPRTDLAVPRGVTLDLVQGAAIGLGDKVTLTVDGVMNIRNGEPIRFEDSTRQATIKGSGTIYLKSKGPLIRIADTRNVPKMALTLDGVTLVGVPDNNNSLVEVNVGGTFVMKSGAITGNTRVNGDAGGVRVNGGTFAMEGGEITDNSASMVGGGVYIIVGGTFTMTGGTISDNTAGAGSYGARNGGGVYVSGSTFIMEGGTISGNSAEEGGGVVIGTEGTFTMRGGRIQGGTDSDGFTKNAASNNNSGSAALMVRDQWNHVGTAKWGTGGTYTKGGVSQTGGSDISNTNDTLIAVPAR
jgi:hypothetical protein